MGELLLSTGGWNELTRAKAAVRQPPTRQSQARRVFCCPKPMKEPRMLQETITRGQPARSWADYVVPQNWESFTEDDHGVWDLLFARQVELLGTRVVSAF